MTLWTLLHFFTFVANLNFVVFLLVRNHRSSLNRLAAGTILCFSIWSLGLTAIRTRDLTVETVTFVNNITSIGWIAFSSFFLTFSLYFTGKRKIVLDWRYRLAVIAPPLFFWILQQNNILVENFRLYSFGWMGQWGRSPFTYLYFSFYALYTLAAIAILALSARKERDAVRRRQVRLVYWSAFIGLCLGSISSVLFRLIGVYTIPPMGDVFTLSLTASLFFTASRYRIFEVTPASAAESILSAMSDGLILAEPDGKVITINRAAESIFSISQDEIAGMNVGSLLDRPGNAVDWLAEISAARGIDARKIMVRRREGASIPVMFSTAVMRDEQGEISGYVFVVRDITELQRVEEELIGARNLAERTSQAKSDFLARMSHEVRTPMNSIIGFTQLLLQEESDPAKLDRMNFIYMAGRHLLRIINDILDFSKIESGTLEFTARPFSLKEMAEFIEKLFQAKSREKGVALTLNIAPAVPPFLLGDEERLRQVVVNLVDNAFKYTASGSISMDCDYRDGQAVIVVTDTGMGIPAENLTKIFDAFEQTDLTASNRYDGVGLGLAISRTIAEGMNGAITVESQVRRGSRFTVTVPLPAVDEQDIHDSAGNGEACLPAPGAVRREFIGKKVLAADDNVMIRKLLENIFEREGIDCDFAENGIQTLALLREHRYDLLVMDIQMPKLDGVATIRAIRQDDSLKGMTVIALTAHALIEEAEKFHREGFDDYITKPIDINDFISRICFHLS